jgi:hypothetical protein|tara:strand:+ start:510 stop:671 length:162 start_codon:yes stop_codon:yes gene_type:complete
MSKKRKDLLKKDKTSTKENIKKVEKIKEVSSDSHVHYVKPRVKTSINDRMRDN